MKKLLGIGTLALALVMPSPARAAVSFQYVTDATSYQAAAGSQATVNVYLQESDTNGSASIIASKNGLFDYGFYVAQSAGGSSGQSTISNYTSGSPFTQFGTGINAQTSSAGQSPSGLPPNSLDYYNANNTSTPNGTATANGYKVLLGQLTVTVGTATTFTLTTQNNPTFLDPGNGGTAQSDNTHTLPPGSGFDLDSSGTAGTQPYTGANNALYAFTVGPAAVPEPSSILLCGLMASGIAGGAWGRWRRRFVGEPATV